MRDSRLPRALAALSSFSIYVLLIYRVFLIILIRDLSPEIQPAALAVLSSYYSSRITGAPWEDDFATQAMIVNKYGQAKRLGFYRAILVNCDLESTKVMVFSQYVKPDANALRQDLIDRLRAGGFNDPEKQKRVKNWINELQIIALFG